MRAGLFTFDVGSDVAGMARPLRAKFPGSNTAFLDDVALWEVWAEVGVTWAPLPHREPDRLPHPHDLSLGGNGHERAPATTTVAADQDLHPFTLSGLEALAIREICALPHHVLILHALFNLGFVHSSKENPTKVNASTTRVMHAPGGTIHLTQTSEMKMVGYSKA